MDTLFHTMPRHGRADDFTPRPRQKMRLAFRRRAYFRRSGIAAILPCCASRQQAGHAAARPLLLLEAPRAGGAAEKVIAISPYYQQSCRLQAPPRFLMGRAVEGRRTYRPPSTGHDFSQAIAVLITYMMMQLSLAPEIITSSFPALYAHAAGNPSSELNIVLRSRQFFPCPFHGPDIK